MLLATQSRRVRKVLEWDSVNMRVTYVPDAQRYTEGSYRKDWELPA